MSSLSHTTTKAFVGQHEIQGSVPELVTLHECLIGTMVVLRILGIYSMDKLKRTDWENVGRYRARKGEEYIKRYGRDASILVL
jgi:hypothetical protein